MLWWAFNNEKPGECGRRWSERRKVEEEDRKFAWKAFHVQKYFISKRNEKLHTHSNNNENMFINLYFFHMYKFILQQVCYYVRHRHIRARAEQKASAYCTFVYQHWKYIKFFLIQISVWLLMGSFIIHRFSITEGILLLWRNVFIRFKVHFSLPIVSLLWKNQ